MQTLEKRMTFPVKRKSHIIAQPTQVPIADDTAVILSVGKTHSSNAAEANSNG